MRYKVSLVRKVTLVNQYLRVFSGTGTRFRSREQLIPVPVPVPGLPVAALVIRQKMIDLIGVRYIYLHHRLGSLQLV